MPEYKFSAILEEKSIIDIWIEADSVEEARQKIDNNDFSWNEQMKHREYLESEIHNPILLDITHDQSK